MCLHDHFVISMAFLLVVCPCFDKSALSDILGRVATMISVTQFVIFVSRSDMKTWFFSHSKIGHILLVARAK